MHGAASEDGHELLADVLLPVANEADARETATAIVSRPHDGGRLRPLLSGDFSQQLIASAHLPVIALPRTETG
jgi:nucleotide-binding universal stress UspA family protein